MTELPCVTLLLSLAGQEVIPTDEVKNTGSGSRHGWNSSLCRNKKAQNNNDETISLLCCHGKSACLQVHQQCFHPIVSVLHPIHLHMHRHMHMAMHIHEFPSGK